MTDEPLPTQLPVMPQAQANPWMEVKYFPMDVSGAVNPVPLTMTLNKDNIVAIRRGPKDVDTCHIHTLSQVDYHCAETYEQVIAKL
jgi:hypothetical protein